MEHHSREASLTAQQITPTEKTERNPDTNPSCSVTNHVDSNFTHQVDDVAVLENQENVGDNQENVCESFYDEDEYFDSFPPGYRFKPEDYELIVHYLAKKISNNPLPANRFRDVELYSKSPATLTAEYKCNGDNEWYFFTPRYRKYPHGERPDRAAGNGYWKATGADKSIRFNGAKIGYRKSLVFYEGKPPRGDKTQWIMHEYRVENPTRRERVGSDMKLDEWVLCKVYKKADKSCRNRDSTEEKLNLDEHPPPPPQPLSTNEQQKQAPILPVSLPSETTLHNLMLPNSLMNHEQTSMLPDRSKLLANPLNHEQTLMLPSQPELFANPLIHEQISMLSDQPELLPNHVNRMEYLRSAGYMQRFHNSAQYPNCYGRGREMVAPVRYPSRQSVFVQDPNGFHHLRIPIHDRPMPMQSNFRYDNQQSNVRYDNQQSNVRYDNQRLEEYHYHPSSSDWNFPSALSHYSSVLSNDNVDDNSVDQFFHMDQNNSFQQQSPFVTKDDR